MVLKPIILLYVGLLNWLLGASDMHCVAFINLLVAAASPSTLLATVARGGGGGPGLNRSVSL